MNKLLLSFLGAFISFTLYAQGVKEEIRQNPLLTASNYMAYPGPQQQELTPAPKGMKPFYISHYGRHGSRYHSKPSMYNAPYLTLAKADSLGKLTPLGHEIMLQLDTIRQDAMNRWGDLTPLGAEQHRQIAHRMVDRFPEVFEGKTTIDARSTTMGRCILSMEYALLEMLKMRPKLKIHHNATHRDMDILNFQDKKIFALKTNVPAKTLYRDYARKHENSSRLMASLFNDSSYVRQHVDASDFDFQLLLLASILHNCEIGKRISLFHLYTLDELYQNWLVGNAYWYIAWGGCTVNGGVQPYTQRNLLRKMVHDADSLIATPRNNVQLRFGHETVLMPLICLMDVNGYGLATDNMDILEEKGWINYRVFPMAANLQLVFYRRHPEDRDVLFKVLLNENEAKLPLPTDQPPYYKWSDFRNYALQKLDAYQE
jgi:hypothetical protein